MSHQEHHQVPGTSYPTLQSQEQQQPGSSFAGQIGQPQQQFLNSQIHMNNLAQQSHEVWQQYYSQIGVHSRPQMPFIGQSAGIHAPLNVYPGIATQKSVNPIGDATIGGILRSQPQQLLFQPHQQQSTSSIYNISSSSSVPDFASLAQQQYMLMAQQQQYLQQQQQQLQQQQHQQQFAIKHSQQIQQITAQQRLSPTVNLPATIASTIPTSSFASPPSQTHAHALNLENSQHLSSQPRQPTMMEPHDSQLMQIQQKPKSLEDAQILAQRELEAQAELKAKEELKKSQIVQEELKRKQINAKEHAQSVQQHLQSFNEPIHLAGCHTLSKVSEFLPFPAEIASTSSSLLPCFDQQQAQLVLASTDSLLADYLGALLSDTTDQLNKIELKHGEVELGNLEGMSSIPPLIQSVQAMNQFAFVVEDESFEATYENANESEKRAENKNSPEQQRHRESPERQHEDRNRCVEMEPKVTTTTKRKKDMVESLYDSLTGYFSNKGQRSRSRTVKHTGTDDDDQTSTTSNERENDDELGMAGDGEAKGRSRKRRKIADDEIVAEVKTPKINRPPTPTEIIKQRELEWNERQKQREEKYKRRGQTQQGGSMKMETWNTDVIAENESFCRFNALLDQVLEQVDEVMIAMPSTMNVGEESGFLLECSLLEELRIEAQKLKLWQKLGSVSIERLTKLLTIMEKNIRDVLTEDGGFALFVKKAPDEDDSDETLRELIDDRLLRSVDAASVAMCIMTSKRVPKQIIMEDIIERSIQLCKHCLQDVIYVSFDSTLKSQAKSSRKSMIDLNSSIMKRQKNSNNILYTRLVDLVSCFSELARFHTLTESLMFQLSSLGTPPFFIENVPEMQMQAIKLLPIIFSKCPPLRKTTLYEMLNSLHRLPLARNIRNSYRLSATESIGNFTVLILQLVQSIVQLPSRKQHHHHHGQYHDSKKGLAEDLDDRLVVDSFEEAKRMAAFFLGGFLAKCTAKAEDDYRRLFEQFLQDILIALYRPMWPVAEMILTVLGNLLVMHFRTKTYDLSLRVASLDYLGIIAARLRKDRVHALSEDATAQDKARLNSIVKGILFDEYSYDPSYNVDDIDISHISSSEKVRKLEQALFDYIIGTMWDGDLSVEYVLLFYAVEWYRETVLDVEMVKERYTKTIAKGEIPHKEKQKYEQKMLRIAEKGQSMKLFIIGLMDKQHLKRRLQLIAKNASIMLECDTHWVAKYLASKKELSQSFDIYLRKILEGFNPEMYPVAIRAKAMKCLAQIVDADYQVLMIPEVNKIVQDRLIDANASVREATFDLIGKCLVNKPELLESYYSILINRTKDTAVAVRKRVIRILREVVLGDVQNKNIDRNSQVLSGILQRVNDEEGVKKLCLETFQQLWMQPTNDRSKLDTKVELLVETAKYCVTEGSLEHFDTLISLLIHKTQEHGTMLAAKQLVDAMVEYVLMLEKKAVQEQKGSRSVNEIVDTTMNYQARLFATLTTLSIFAKARPELLIRHIEVFVPYLSVTDSSTLESRVINQIITMLEQIIPLMDNYDTSVHLIRQIDSRLNEIAKDGGMLLIASAISCMNAIHAKFQQQEQPCICKLFIVYYKYLDKCKREIEVESELNPDRKPNLLRALYSMGLMCRYFDFDTHLNKNQLELLQINTAFTTTNGASNESQNMGIVKTSVFSLLFYFSRSPDYIISQKALIALGQLTAGYPEFLRREELKSMYMVLLNTDKRIYLHLKVQVLKNIACFLFAEEQKALKRAHQAKQEREKQQKQEDDSSLMLDSSDEQSQHATEVDDLKEMDFGSSGLSSSIIQQYWTAILNCYFHNDETVRTNSAQVIRQTLEQGLVTPGSSIPTLVAMSTDPLSIIRSRVEILIRDMNTKYKGLILSKAIPGVRLTFQLHKKIRPEQDQIIRGFRANENPLNSIQTSEKKLPTFSADAQSLLGTFYTNIRTNRQGRRNFLSSLLKIFSEEHKERVERDEWLFLADNLSHFPYSVMDEPLYVIHHANSIISISGQNILSQFRQLLVKTLDESYPNQYPYQPSGNTPTKQRLNESSASMNMDELEEFSIQYIIDHLPEDLTMVHELKRNSQACFILLHLKTFLMRMYGLKEDKIVEYSPSDAANVYEKPINRRNVPVFSTDFIINELANRQEQSVLEEKRKIAEDFHKFHEMLLSLDEKRDEDEDLSMAVTETQNITMEEGEFIA